MIDTSRVELSRANTSTLFGGDASSLTLEAEFQSDYRLRIKVRLKSFEYFVNIIVTEMSIAQLY
jgi:hypothetical protein